MYRPGCDGGRTVARSAGHDDLPAAGDTGDPARVSLGLPGFVVLAAGEYGGELELLVETTERVTGCPRCGTVATLHD